MKISKLILNDAHRMNEKEMKGTRGGVSAHEYCCVLACIGLYNSESLSNNGYYYGITTCSAQGMSNITCCFKVNEEDGSPTCDYKSC